MSDPAIALLEFASISAGIVAGDAMVKTAPVGSVYAGTVHPGRFLVLVSGDTASVEVALSAGSEIAGDDLIDSVFLPDIHRSVAAGIVGSEAGPSIGHEALGIVETTTVAAVIDAADAGVKAAHVELAAIRLADGLGGKGYLLFSGMLAEVDAAVDAAVARIEPHGSLVRSDVIAQLHAEMAENLGSNARFLRRVAKRGG